MMQKIILFVLNAILLIGVGYLLYPYCHRPTAPAALPLRRDTTICVKVETTIVTKGRVIRYHDTVSAPNIVEIPCPPETVKVSIPVVSNVAIPEWSANPTVSYRPSFFASFAGAEVFFPIASGGNGGGRRYSFEYGYRLRPGDLEFDFVPLQLTIENNRAAVGAVIRGRWMINR